MAWRRILPCILLAAACSGCIQSVIYQKTQTPPEVIEKLTQEFGWERHSLDVADGEVRLMGLEKLPEHPDRPWLLFFGGNGMPIGASAVALDKACGDNDFGLAVYAYRGYDGSTGTPTEANLVSDAERVARDLMKRRGLAAQRLYLMGHSLGSGVAAQLTIRLLRTRDAPGGLVLVSPYTALPDVVTEMIPVLPLGWLLEDRYDTRSLLKDLDLPVLVVHGGRDKVISVEQGRKIAEELGVRATFVVFEKRGHNDIFLDRRFPGVLEGFVK